MSTVTRISVILSVILVAFAIAKSNWSLTPFGASANLAPEPTLAPEAIQAAEAAAKEADTAGVASAEEASFTPTPSPTPIEVKVDLTTLEMGPIIEALSKGGLVVANRQIFGDSWVTKTGQVTGTLPEGYNVLVISSDAASFQNKEISFATKAEGFRAVVVTTQSEFVINNIAFNPQNGHRNISAFALKVEGSQEEVTDFAVNLAAYEWAREHKPTMFFAVGAKVVKASASTVEDISSKEDLRGVLLSLLKEK